MSLDMVQLAEAFCSHKFAETFPYMADEIKWNMIGREECIGREAVIAHCNQGTKFLETVSTTHLNLKIYPRRILCHCGRRGTISRSRKSDLQRRQL